MSTERSIQSIELQDCKNELSQAPQFSRRTILATAISAYAALLYGCGDGEGSISNDGSGGTDVDLESGKTYAADWTSSIVPESGGLPVWSVSADLATPTVRDCWGMMRNCRLGEARFVGARRVENKIRHCADLTFSPFWFSVGSASTVVLTSDSREPDITGTFRTHRLSKTGANSARVQSVGILPSAKHTFSVYAKSETLTKAFLQFYVSGGPIIASGTFDLVADKWTRIQVTGVPDGQSACRVFVSPGPFVDPTSGSILICDPQLEDVSGHPNDAASEFVGADFPRQPPWFNGAMVDGVKYYTSFKGNTVSAGVVSESEGTPIPTADLRGIQLDPRAVNLCSQSESFSNWTFSPSSLILEPGAEMSPRGDFRATRLKETATTAARTLTLGLGAIELGSALSVSCFAKAETGNWLNLAVSTSDGAFFSAFYDIRTGALGKSSAANGRPIWYQIESWANGWFRCSLILQNSLAGTRLPELAVSLASGDGSVSGVGNGRTILVWGAQASPTDYVPTYIPNPTDTAPVSRQSQSIELVNPNFEILGPNDFVLKVDSYLSCYSGITIKGGATPSWRAVWYGVASGFYRNQHRLGVVFRPTTVVTVGDRYLGDPNPLYYWRPNHKYSVGDIAIPGTTSLDNPEGNKMFVCVEAGNSGASEPVWNSTFVASPDKSTAITQDGSALWQNNHPDLEGKWQPYDTSVINKGYANTISASVGTDGTTAQIPMSQVVRSSYFSAPGAYGFAINGESGVRVTTPFPIDGTTAGDLHRSPDSIRFGRLEETASGFTISVCRLAIYRRRDDAKINEARSAI